MAFCISARVEPSLEFEHDLPLAADGGVLTNESLKLEKKYGSPGISQMSPGSVSNIGESHSSMDSCR